MNTEFMMVNPNELVIDMPVDEANVRQKMESLQANGVIQPVTVWLQGMRIIDGFHRTVAAVRLGWSEIPCNVIDCTEEAFWDARIQSAKQHHAIEKNRLVAWMAESWRNSEWFIEGKINVPLLPRAYEIPPEAKSMAKLVWQNMVKNSDGGLWSDRTSDDAEMFFGWLNHKSKAWGISAQNAAQNILEFAGVFRWNEDGGHPIDKVSRELDLTFEQRQTVAEQIGFVSDRVAERYDSDILKKWVLEEVMSEKQEITPIEIYHQKALNRRKKEAKDAARHQYYLNSLKRSEHERTPSGQVEAAKLRIDAIREEIEVMGYRLDKIDNYLAKTPEAATMLTEFVLLIESKVKAAFPEYALKSQTNPLLAANAELRRKVREQDERIASLERALKSKGNVSRNVVAMASEELERIN